MAQLKVRANKEKFFRINVDKHYRPNFCVCMFLDSADKSINMLKFCRNDQKKVKNKRRTKGGSLLGNPLTMHKTHNLASTRNEHSDNRVFFWPDFDYLEKTSSNFMSKKGIKLKLLNCDFESKNIKSAKSQVNLFLTEEQNFFK